MRKLILPILLILISAAVVAHPPADAYADEVVDSFRTDDPENALGNTQDYAVIKAPERECANWGWLSCREWETVEEGGWAIYDMGAGEEILDTSGIDFLVLEEAGDKFIDCATVSASYFDPDSGTEIGFACKDSGFMIGWAGFSKVRYIKIENKMGGAIDRDFELRAIEAVEYNNEVPEFSVIGAMVVLVAAGIYIYKKRN